MKPVLWSKIFFLLLLGVFVFGKPLEYSEHKSEPNRPSEELGVEGAFQSDIQLTPEQAREIKADDFPSENGRLRRKASSNMDSLWPKGIVPYEFENNFPWTDVVLEAIRRWEDETCIMFKEVSPSIQAEVGHTNVLKFSRGSGCSSTIGRYHDGGTQETFLGDNCRSVGATQHEIGHVIGFYHEQSRPDRDDHVLVTETNVARGRLWEFKKYDRNHIRIDEPYDIGSVMHYGPTWFSKDNRAHTMDAKDARMTPIMGQRHGLSFMDVKTANKLYNCNRDCPTRLVCENGGYVGPRCTCVCPKGLSGQTCSEVSRGSTACGAVLRQAKGTITSPGYPGKYTNSAICNWMIKADEERTITLTFEMLSIESSDKCDYDSLEIKLYGTELAGPKFCGVHQMPDPIVYQGQSLVIRFLSDSSENYAGFKINYTIQ